MSWESFSPSVFFPVVSEEKQNRLGGSCGGSCIGGNCKSLPLMPGAFVKLLDTK